MTISQERLNHCLDKAVNQLLSERTSHGFWEGELSTSALSTATAVMALEMIVRDHQAKKTSFDSSPLTNAIRNGLRWLSENQNPDGGWGDTTKSVSNISTTMLVHASLKASSKPEEYSSVKQEAEKYIREQGGVPAVIARYGKDKTFSIPILTHCALAGEVDWKEIKGLPFELSCIPARFYKTVKLPVVSYALPALIAIGQVGFHFHPTRNPLTRMIRKLCRKSSLKKLEKIQPENGGFLEATPLTSFVTMSLAGMGLSDHPVAQKGLQFILDSVREDGSWPIDTNLSTWLTTLSVNALEERLPEDSKQTLIPWLLQQQYREIHPYTNADPGGWAWTDLPGGVPDADDTPGAILAIIKLDKKSIVPEIPEIADTEISDDSDQDLPDDPPEINKEMQESLVSGITWLLDLQNSDRGWPTFCKGWGTLPFDKSAADITAHVLRALVYFSGSDYAHFLPPTFYGRVNSAFHSGMQFLSNTQHEEGYWLPLWFGNQEVPRDENPVYGTARVLMAYRDSGKSYQPEAKRGVEFLKRQQNEDGGWGGRKGATSSVEETALAVEAILGIDPKATELDAGIEWLVSKVESGQYTESSPIGFYFANLWYFEELYPQIFTVSALKKISNMLNEERLSQNQSAEI